MKLTYLAQRGYVYDKDGGSIIAYLNRPERWPDLGRQMAAAPRLLAALKALVPADFDEHAGDFADDWHEARAAIREAEGE